MKGYNMKKLALPLLCALCLLIAVPACAKAGDIEDATKVINAYYDTLAKGDLIAALNYMSKEYRAEREQRHRELLENKDGMKIYAIQMEHFSYKITSIDQEDGEIIAQLAITEVDAMDVIAKVSEDVGPNSDISEEAFADLVTKKFIELSNSKALKISTDEFEIILIKEDGQWKINEY